MNHQSINQPRELGGCDFYGPLLSAMLDGELGHAEQTELESHLKTCQACRSQAMGFQNVNAIVQILSAELGDFSETELADSMRSEVAPLPLSNSTKQLPTKQLPTKHFSSNQLAPRSKGAILWRLVPFAGAASLLVCLAMTAIPSPRPANAGQILPEQIVEPMRALQRINSQQQRNQDLMVRTLALDLRSLKLELVQMEPGSTERSDLAEQIDSMIAKVSAFASESHTNQGLIPE